MNKKRFKIGIVGAGRAGEALAVLLDHSGVTVEIASRHRKAEIGTKTTAEYIISGDFDYKKSTLKTVASPLDFSNGLDFIIVTTKAYDTLDYLPQALKKLKKDGAFVSIQNSFYLTRIMKRVPAEKSISMIFDCNCMHDFKGVYVNNCGGVSLGVYNKDAYDPMIKFHGIVSKFCEVTVVSNVIGFLLSRSIINSTISALGAISGLKLGDIMNDRNGRYLFKKLITESLAVFKKFKLDILPYNKTLDYYLFTENSRKGNSYARKIMNILGKNNKNVKSSALYELEHGKVTELEFSFSLLLKYAEKARLKLPYTRSIFEMIKEITQKQRAITKNAFYDKKLLNIKE